MDADTKCQLMSFVQQRLLAAAEEIIGEVEKTITLVMYEAEVSRSKEEFVSLRRQMGLVRHNSAELPSTSAAVEHRDKADTAPLQEEPGPSSQAYSAKASESRADRVTRSYCLAATALQMADIKEEREPLVAERGAREAAFASPELVKSEQEPQVSYEIRLVSVHSPAAESEDASEEVLVNGRASQMGQSGSKKTQAAAAEKSRSPRQRRFCDMCGKGFQYMGSLAKHVKKHKRQVNCTICVKSFISKKALMRHQQDCHKDINSCRTCGESFSSNRILREHEKMHKDVRHNSTENPYECDFCGKGFPQMGEMMSHRMLHAGERPYACPLCDMTYRFGPFLREHMKTHEKAAASENA